MKTCSFMPTACNLDSNYLNRIINESIQYLFPPIDYQFDCYYSNKPENMDTLLILPDKTGYYGSIIILAIGELLGLITCLYGWIGIKISKSKSKYFGNFLKFLSYFILIKRMGIKLLKSLQIINIMIYIDIIDLL